MSITAKTVEHVANLARLDIPDDELETFTGQLGNILELMNQLKEVPTDGVEPMSHAVAMNIPLRDDEVTNVDRREAMLANAPEQEEDHFRVPKVIE